LYTFLRIGLFYSIIIYHLPNDGKRYVVVIPVKKYENTWHLRSHTIAETHGLSRNTIKFFCQLNVNTIATTKLLRIGNVINRYNSIDRGDVYNDADGSLVVVLQANSPQDESNWLPVGMAFSD
jgi:hypothetical protein